MDADVVEHRDGRLALAVRRFDRMPGGTSRPVEDACQVLNRYPADKYTVTTEPACAALSMATGAPVVAGRELLRWVAFAYVSCDGDLHAKNLSVIGRDHGEFGIAPAYDLPSSFPYGDTTMALSLNGKDRENIGHADMLALASQLRVSRRAAEKVIDGVAGAVEAWLPMLDALPFADRMTVKWTKAVQYRRRRLAA